MKPQDLIDYYKTPLKAAEALGCAYPRVYEWRTKGEIPLFRQWQIQLLTKGKLKAISLRDMPEKKAA